MRRTSPSIPLLLLVLAVTSSTTVVAARAPGREGNPATRLAGGCPDDADCDGISDLIEAQVGPQGFSVASGTLVASAVLAPDGTIEFELASAITPGQAALVFPAGTTAGPSPISLDYGVYGASPRPSVVVDGAQLAGATKTIEVPRSSPSQTVVVLVDEPGATRTDLLTASPRQRFVIPPCPCPASTSVNALGEATPYTVTNLDGTDIVIQGLSFSAVGLADTLTPVPALSMWGLVAGAGALFTAGAGALARRRRQSSASNPA